MKNDGSFPELTILPDTPEPPQRRLSNAEKYGSLYWLGISGLIVSVMLVGWFAWNLIAMRGVWQAVYVLHDELSSKESRIQAAESLIAEPRVQTAQVQPMIFRKPLPEKARYLLAESLPKSVSPGDARQMLSLLATTNATSPPPWLRGHLSRLAAVTIPPGNNFPASAFRELVKDEDPIVADWAAFALTRTSVDTDVSIGQERLKKRAGEGSMLAGALLEASSAQGDRSTASLALALRAMRSETAANQAVFSP